MAETRSILRAIRDFVESLRLWSLFDAVNDLPAAVMDERRDEMLALRNNRLRTGRTITIPLVPVPARLARHENLNIIS